GHQQAPEFFIGALMNLSKIRADFQKKLSELFSVGDSLKTAANSTGEKVRRRFCIRRHICFSPAALPLPLLSPLPCRRTTVMIGLLPRFPLGSTCFFGSFYRRLINLCHFPIQRRCLSIGQSRAQGKGKDQLLGVTIVNPRV